MSIEPPFAGTTMNAELVRARIAVHGEDARCNSSAARRR